MSSADWLLLVLIKSRASQLLTEEQSRSRGGQGAWHAPALLPGSQMRARHLQANMATVSVSKGPNMARTEAQSSCLLLALEARSLIG